MSSLTLIHGKEPILVQRSLREAISTVMSVDPTAQVVEVSAGSEDGGAAIRMACSPTLFGDASIVVVTGVESADDTAIAVLQDSIDHPVEGVHLVLVHPAGNAANKAVVEKAKAAGANLYDCAPLKGAKAYREFVTREFTTHRRKATPDAVEALIDSIGTDAAMLSGAVTQLVSDVSDSPLTADHVHEYFTGVAEISGFSISDAAWSRREVDVRRMVRQLAVVSGSGSGPMTVAALATGVRTLVKVGGLTGATDGAIAREAGIPDWKVRQLREQWSRWGSDQRRLAASIVALADADGAMKGGVEIDSALDSEQKLYALESLIGSIAHRSGERAPA
jgi:DNA polymerase III subunit delta